MLKKLGALSVFSILTSAAFAQCDNNGIRNGLVARYTFAGGLTDDSSGLGNHGVNNGAQSGPGISGESVNFSDNSQYVLVPNSPSINPQNAITISAWWFATDMVGTGSDPIIDKGAECHCAPYYQYHLAVTGTQYGTSPGAIGFNVATSAGQFGAGTAANFYTVGRWYHIVGMYNGTSASVWVNGELVNSNPASPGIITDRGRPMFIGHFSNLAASIRGGIDEVRIFNRGLSADEIQYLFQHPDDSPGFVQQPHSQAFCHGNVSTFSAAVSGATPISYQWFKDGQPLSDSATISGAHTPSLSISNAQSSSAGLYRVEVLASCGTLVSNSATLEVCPANFNCDSAVDFFDYLDFVDAFASNQPNSDFNYDEVIDFFDYLDFVDAFASGC